MEGSHEWFLEGLSAHRLALSRARRALADGEAGADDVVQHLARELESEGRAFGAPEVARSAADLLTAGPAVALPLLDRLAEAVAHRLEGRASGAGVVLLVADPGAPRDALAGVLADAGHRVLCAYSLKEATELLDVHEIALVVLDLGLLADDGREVLARLGRRSREGALPIVALAPPGETARLEAYALGADQVIGAPADAMSLAATVAARLRGAGEAARRAHVDSLTGLPNRAALREAFDRWQVQRARTGGPLSLGLLDLDRLKAINDTRGHAAGDEVIRGVAGAVRSALRATDLVARWGGEEFVAVFPATSPEDAANALAQALHALRAIAFGAPRMFHATFSAGVTAVHPGADLDRALLDADRILYRAKAAGRNLILTEREGMLPPPRVLLVEDDPVTAAYVKGILSAEGLDAVQVEDGARACAAAADLDVALVILDVMLPHATGFDVLQSLRRSAGGARVPILMLTAMRSPTDVARGFELGADDYMFKPFEPLELRARIRHLLRRG